MQLDKIKWTKEFSFHGFPEWATLGGTLEEKDDPTEQLLVLRQTLIDTFNQVLSEKNVPVIKKKEVIDLSGDAEFNDLKEKLAAFEFQEEAQEYLDTTPFKLTLEAKKIVALKPFKLK